MGEREPDAYEARSIAERHPASDRSDVVELCGGVPAHRPLDHAAWERLFH